MGGFEKYKKKMKDMKWLFLILRCPYITITFFELRLIRKNGFIRTQAMQSQF